MRRGHGQRQGRGTVWAPPDDGPGGEASNRLRIVASILAAICLLGGACSEPARYRVLTFFFDGVPVPGQAPAVGYEVVRRELPGSAGGRRAQPSVINYTHTPFRKDDCGACHNPTSGQLFSTDREGLCAGCHRDVPGPARYVHGPVAVSDCLFCHHPHGSAYPGVLVAEATALCLRCHARADLSEGAHHADIDERSCIDCHHPHAGDDRFFLKHGDR